MGRLAVDRFRRRGKVEKLNRVDHSVAPELSRYKASRRGSEHGGYPLPKGFIEMLINMRRT
jgi:hypothetical protein